MATIKRTTRFRLGDRVRFTRPSGNIWGNEGVREAFENRTVFTVTELNPETSTHESKKMIQISINDGYWVNRDSIELVEKRKRIRAWSMQ